MRFPFFTFTVISLLAVISGYSQSINPGESKSDDWDRTQEILNCVPKLVDRRDLVEDNFKHSYVTTNPRDIEVGYFSVEPITYFEEGRRFCEASLPAAGVSQSYFRGTYETTYVLPGDRVYHINVESNALIFNNGIRIINAQNTVAEIEASHRLQIIADTSLNPSVSTDPNSSTSKAYTWEVEIDETGKWQGNVCNGDCILQNEEIPSGNSTISLSRKIRGPGVVIVKESVIFHVDALSSYKYELIFQAVCQFNLEPLSVSAKLLPCEE
ncbi:MAG: hypothetical protein KAR19_11695 [Bacteroidales bacterium]|nr:hypothetical protein [Bacteroidales bacterium]